MSNAHDDTKIRNLAVEYWQGELPEIERARIEQYLSENPETRSFYSHVGEILKAATDEDLSTQAESWFRERGDVVRERLVGDLGLHERNSGVRTSVAAPVIDIRSRLRSAPIWLGAAAAVALLAFGLSSLVTNTGDEVATVVRPAPPARAIAPADFEGLSLQQDVPEEITLFASEGAVYSFSSDAEATILSLKKGTLLGEYIADGRSKLRVIAPHREFVVVGTVFYVSTDETVTRAGVAHGAVAFKSEAGETRINAGECLNAEQKVAPISKPVLEAIQAYVDLDEHAEKIAAAKRPAVKPTVKRSKLKPAIEVEPPAPTASELAYDALAQGRHSEAATLLEQAIAERGASRSRYLLLDLIRLYTSELNSPAKAVSHSRTFLRLWPNDPQAAQIRERLCSTLGDEVTPTDHCPSE